MVGRLIEHEYIRLSEQHACKREPRPLSARQDIDLLLLVLFGKTHGFENSRQLASVCIAALLFVLLDQSSVFCEAAVKIRSRMV